MENAFLPPMKIYITPQDVKFLLFENPEVISDEIRNFGLWNSSVLMQADKILKKQPNGLVLDIGAGIGSIAIPLAIRFNDRMDFICFEPIRIISMQLGANVLLNNLANVRVENVGLGDTNKKITSNTLDVNRNGNHGSFSFNERVNELRGIVPTDEKHRYEILPLDDYNLRDIRLIKLSAPGMELDVLKGAIKTIKSNDRPPIIFEIWGESWYSEEREATFQFLRDNWYTHFTDLGNGHFVAYRTEAQFEYFESTLEVEQNGSFMVAEKLHDVEETLKNQKVYNQ